MEGVTVSREVAVFLYELLNQQQVQVGNPDFVKLIGIIQQAQQELQEGLR